MIRRLTFTLLTLMFTASPALAGDTLNVERELSRPGVKLLAVDVYATWCEPCMKAMPKWRALRDKYRDQGLRVIMVHTQDPSKPCGEGVKDFADDVICDEKGYMAKWLRVRDELPSAFLWSWQGNMLVKTGHYDKVEAEVKRYLDSVPRVVVEAKSANSQVLDSNLRDLVRAELKRASKFTLVATDEERALAAKIRKESFKGNYSKSSRCKLGQELSANASLQVSITGKKKRRNLNLNLFSAETSCSLGMASVPYNEMNEIASVQEGVDKLMSQLRSPTIEMPSGAKRGAGIKQAGFGAELGAVSVANVEELELGEVSFDISGADIDFLEAWVKFEEEIKGAAAVDKQEGDNFDAKIKAWKKVASFKLPKVPEAFKEAYGSRLSEARARLKAWSDAKEAKRKADQAWAAATAKYNADKSKLDRFMKLPDTLVAAEQKQAYREEFEGAYAQYLAEKERREWTKISVEVLAQCSDGSSCTNLGYNYEVGQGVSKDLKRANALYEKACELKYGQGCNNLGVYYENGWAVTKNFKRANAFYEKACELKHGGACTSLGYSYEQGRGVAKDLKRARALYEKSCELKYGQGCNNLGVYYENGWAVTKNIKRANAFYAKACELGYEEACGKRTEAYGPVVKANPQKGCAATTASSLWIILMLGAASRLRRRKA